MARPKYLIAKNDAFIAYRWIQNKLAEFQWPSDDWDRENQSEQEFEALEERWNNPETLNAWAEKWLDREQWTQLKNAVRAQRKRQRDRSDLDNKPRSITLSPKAHLILSTIAERDGVTLSAVIEKRLYDTYMSGLDQEG